MSFNKEILILIASKVADEELVEPKKLIEKKGVNVTIAGLTSETKTVKDEVIKPDLLIKEINDLNQYDGILIPGGSLEQALSKDENTENFLKKANEVNKIIAAICAGTVVLSNFGLLKNRKFTTYHKFVPQLQETGGLFVEGAIVVQDENIITCNPIGTYIKDFSNKVLTNLFEQ